MSLTSMLGYLTPDTTDGFIPLPELLDPVTDVEGLDPLMKAAIKPNNKVNLRS